MKYVRVPVSNTRACPDSTSIAPLSPVTETVMSFGLPWSSHVTRDHARELHHVRGRAHLGDETRAFGGRRLGAGGVERADEADTRERHDADGSDEPPLHRRPASGPIGTRELIESPTSEVAAPCCVATAVTFGRTAVRPGTTTTAITAAATAAAPAIQPARDFRCPPGFDGDDRGAFGGGVVGTLVVGRFHVREHRVPETGRRLASGQPAHGRARDGDLVELGAQLDRRGEPRFDLHALVDGELAVEISREEGVIVGSVPERASRVVGHGPITPPAVSEARNMRRPRWIRDRTVPIGTPVDSAICS